MTDPAAPHFTSRFVSTDSIVVGIIKLLEAVTDIYRDKDLPPVREVVYGVPVEFPNLPVIAVIPDSGVDEEPACDVSEKRDLVRIRLYLEFAEGRGSYNAFPPVVRYIDFLRQLLKEYRVPLDPEGCPLIHGLYEIWPARWFFATFIDEDRNGNEVLIRGAELELDCLSHERVRRRTSHDPR